MTIGPGALIFHRLKSFKILKNHVIPVSNFVGSQNEIMLSPAAIIKIPYMRPFFFAVSMPCFSLLYYFWTFFCNNQVPDPILFACALFPIYFTSVKMSTNYISFLVAFLSLPITFSILKINDIPIDITSEINNYTILYILIFIQYFSLTNSLYITSNSYYEYTHPPLSIFDCDGAIPILERLYSHVFHVMITIWHHCSFIIIISYFLVKSFCTSFKPNSFLIVSAIIFSFLTYICTKFLIQLHLITIILPSSEKDQRNTKTVKKLVSPIGKIAFGLTAIPSHLLIMAIGWIYCQTFKNDDYELYSWFIEELLLSGIILSGFARLFSFIHPFIPNLGQI